MEGFECRQAKIKVGTRTDPLVLLDKTEVEWAVENFWEDLKSHPVNAPQCEVTIEKNAELPTLKWRVSLEAVQIKNGDEYRLQLCWALIDGYQGLSRNKLFVQIGMQSLKQDGRIFTSSEKDFGPKDLCDCFESATVNDNDISIDISTEYGHGNSKKHLENLPLRSDGSLLFRITFQHYAKRFSTTRLEKEVNPKTMDCWLKHFESRAEADIQSVEGRNTDIEIISSDGKAVHFHNDLLTARSPVFEAMFRTEMKESESGIVNLDDLSEEAVNFIHVFIYDGKMLPCIEAQKNGEDLGKLEQWIYISSKYQFEEFIKFFDELFGNLCTEGNAMDLLKLCNRFSLMGVREDVRRFIYEHPEVLNNFI